MDDLLELLLEIMGDILGIIPFKNLRTRRWVLTGFYGIIGLVLTGLFAVLTVTSIGKENTREAIVAGIATVLFSAFFVFAVIRGHKTNWKNA